jgi:ABC-type branched-subunit amino acid transport system substrate-binding protein
MRRGVMVRGAVFAALAAVSFILSPARAGSYDVGATDTEIKLGQTMPYSGPASSYATIGRTEAAYFAMINEAGGINGRKINFISLDDGYSPPKTLEQVRRLVEQDQVLALFQVLGTPTNTAIHKYVNQKKMPHLFVATGATKWGDPKNFPWTMGWQPSYQAEMLVMGRYIAKTYPDKKIAALWQNDDSGKDYMFGLRQGLGEDAKNIIADASYEVTDPTVDSQIVQLASSGASIFFVHAVPKFGAMALRKAYDIGWKRDATFLVSVAASVETGLKPAGLEKVQGVITTAYAKDPTDPQWRGHKDFDDWLAFMAKYYPEGSLLDSGNSYGYAVAATMVQVLKQCGDDLTRANVMKQAANLKDFVPPMLLPGIKLNTGPDDFFPIEQMQMARFDGEKWALFGDLIDAAEIRLARAGKK